MPVLSPDGQYHPIAKLARPVKRSAKEIREERRPQCEWCAKKAVQTHHVTTRGAGGGDEMDNCMSVCAECHDKIHKGQIGAKELREFIVQRNYRIALAEMKEAFMRLKKWRQLREQG